MVYCIDAEFDAAAMNVSAFNDTCQVHVWLTSFHDCSYDCRGASVNCSLKSCSCHFHYPCARKEALDGRLAFAVPQLRLPGKGFIQLPYLACTEHKKALLKAALRKINPVRRQAGAAPAKLHQVPFERQFTGYWQELMTLAVKDPLKLADITLTKHFDLMEPACMQPGEWLSDHCKNIANCNTKYCCTHAMCTATW